MTGLTTTVVRGNSSLRSSVYTLILVTMSGHRCATWILLLMLTCMMGMRTAVVAYCLCMETVRFHGDCCCEHVAGPSSHDGCCPVETSGSCYSTHPDHSPSHNCDTVSECPGDLYFSFDHDSFLIPALRSFDLTGNLGGPGHPVAPPAPLWEMNGLGF